MARIEVPLDTEDLTHLEGVLSDAAILANASELFSVNGLLTIEDSNGNHIAHLSFDTETPSLIF